MDDLLRGIPGVICYIDDILVTGKDEESHANALQEVFKRLQDHGFRLKDMAEVEYLGHQIGQNGIRPLPNKVTAIVNAPTPTHQPSGAPLIPWTSKLLW